MSLFSRKPKIKITSTKKDGFSGWLKCTRCSELIHSNQLQENLHCCNKCSYHYRLPVDERIALMTDQFEALFCHFSPGDPLEFVDIESYEERLRRAQEKTGRKDALVTGRALLEGMPYALAIMDFGFMGGSMGSVVGEQLCCLIEYAIEERLPLVVVATSGGARMQESTLSLMQMAKTSGMLGKYKEAGLVYLSILTNPTTGGVTASFASLGDIVLAEPDALICFAGPRVIEQILGKPMPEGAQRSEFLLEHGMIDHIVPRNRMRKVVSQLLQYGHFGVRADARE